jgi:hypothetical protein
MKRIIILAVMLGVCSLLAFAQFDHVINVSNTPDTPSQWPQVAFGPDGKVHIVYVENWSSSDSDVMYANYDGTTLSTPIKLTEPGVKLCYFPHIAMNDNGKIAVIWAQYDEHWVRIFDPVQGEWLPPEMIAGPDYGWGYLSRPKIGIDNDGNVYTFFFARYNSFSRSLINGVWEGIFQLDSVGVASKEGAIAVAPDGWIWVVYGIKSSGGDYKVAYRKRTKSTGWGHGAYVNDSGKSQESCYVGVGVNSIPCVSYIGNAGKEGSNAVNVFTLDEKTNPAENVAPVNNFHYPRVAVDTDGKRWVATQFGQGDHGLGVWLFTDSEGDYWKSLGILPFSSGEIKLPGIASEAYGNIAVSYDSLFNGFKEAWFTTRYPVELKHFYAPVNASVAIAYTGVLSSEPSVGYSLSWAKNPDNNDKYIRGYKIYTKLGSGDWQFLNEFDKNTLTLNISYSGVNNPYLAQKVQFAVSTVSITGIEGDRVTF